MTSVQEDAYPADTLGSTPFVQKTVMHQIANVSLAARYRKIVAWLKTLAVRRIKGSAHVSPFRLQRSPRQGLTASGHG